MIRVKDGYGERMRKRENEKEREKIERHRERERVREGEARRETVSKRSIQVWFLNFHKVRRKVGVFCEM